VYAAGLFSITGFLKNQYSGQHERRQEAVTVHASKERLRLAGF
jgi:hypothetical protein